MSEATLLARITALEARVADLEAGGGKAAGTGGGGPTGAGEVLSDHLLNEPWADKVISKDPGKWKGVTQVGRKYSKAPLEWLLMKASGLEWKAQKGREEIPVRLNDKGKPWHLSDSFEAKILRGWAARAEKKPATAKATKPAADDDFGGAKGAADDDFGGSATGSDDEIPF